MTLTVLWANTPWATYFLFVAPPVNSPNNFVTTETPQDYEGQRLASRIMYIILVSSTVVAVPVGVVLGNFAYSLLTLVIGAVICCLAILPPWPMYRKHPVELADSSSEEKKNQ